MAIAIKTIAPDKESFILYLGYIFFQKKRSKLFQVEVLRGDHGQCYCQKRSYD